ncbi:MAG: ABC transporter substrate-binding protein [Clostridia bacterium]|nr:ABC transporter substrate-binding protein [Clostridia bacterium]
MKNTFFKVLAICLCLVMLASCFVGCSKDPSNKKGQNKDGEYVIGLSGPLTGPAAVYGTAVANAAQMAVDEINAAGGLNGAKFKLIALDDQHDPSKVETNYANMMDNGMHVSLGCVTTNPCLEFAALSAEDNVFFLTPSASANSVVDEDNAYQMCFADGNQGAVAAAYVNSLGLDKIGIFYKSDDNYSKGIYDQFKAALNSSIATVEASFLGEATDFTQQIEILKDCSFIFMPIYYTPASNFMLAAKGKIADNATYYGCDGFDGIESADGFDITTIPQKVSMLSHFNSKATDGKAGEFITKYTAKYGKDTLNQFGASAYDCVYAIYNALKAAIDDGADISPKSSASEICDVLKEQFNGGFSYSGATGENIKWNSTGFVDKGAIAFTIKEAN